MGHIYLFDPQIDAYVKSTQSDSAGVQSFRVDPTEGDIWEMKYLFFRDDVDYPAVLSDIEPFESVVDGKIVGMEEMLNNEFVLMNDAGIELSYRDALRVKDKILRHQRGEI